MSQTIFNSHPIRDRGDLKKWPLGGQTREGTKDILVDSKARDGRAAP
jgi:hypothetical protein